MSTLMVVLFVIPTISLTALIALPLFVKYLINKYVIYFYIAGEKTRNVPIGTLMVFCQAEPRSFYVCLNPSIEMGSMVRFKVALISYFISIRLKQNIKYF